MDRKHFFAYRDGKQLGPSLWSLNDAWDYNLKTEHGHHIAQLIDPEQPTYYNWDAAAKRFIPRDKLRLER